MVEHSDTAVIADMRRQRILNIVRSVETDFKK